MSTRRIIFNNDRGDMEVLLAPYDGSVSISPEAPLYNPGTVDPVIWGTLYGEGNLQVDIPDTPVPDELGTNMTYTPTKTTPWPRQLTHLMDVKPVTTDDVGKTLIVDPTDGYLFVFGFPSKLAEARKITIGSEQGDIVESHQMFDGSSDIVFDPVVRHATESDDAYHADVSDYAVEADTAHGLENIDDLQATLQELTLHNVPRVFPSMTAGDIIIRTGHPMEVPWIRPGFPTELDVRSTPVLALVPGTCKVTATLEMDDSSTDTANFDIEVDNVSVYSESGIYSGNISQDITVTAGQSITLRLIVTGDATAKLTNIAIKTNEGSPLQVWTPLY